MAKNEEMENNKGLDIISATELPATGEENQLCIITDSNPSKFIITSNLDDPNVSNDSIMLYTSDTSNYPITINNGIVSKNYFFKRITQQAFGLESYYYENGIWNKVTEKNMIFLENKKYYNIDIHGGITTDYASYLESTVGIRLNCYNSSYWYYVSFKNPIDVTKYSTIQIKASCAVSNTGNLFYIVLGNQQLSHESENALTDLFNHATNSITLTTTNTTYEFDITGKSGVYYVGFCYNSPNKSAINISDVILL